jgi:hypothetical protein
MFFPGYRCIEDETPARDRAEQLLLVVAECATDIDDALCQCAVRDDGPAPDRFHELVLADELSSTLHEVTKDGERFWPKLDL